ncbi:MAG TPA: ComF family protein [Steroidobacteraceae bacterium]|nr:ComF family protein [Steroidobacteraceae bacterium]
MFESAESIVNRGARLRLTMARHWSRALAATLFPPQCCLCGFPGASLDLDLCEVCRDDLPWIRESSPGTLVAFGYLPPIDDLIRDLKYRGITPNARVLGVLLAQAALERGGALPRLLVPVPLHDARLRERGFNQAAVLARHAGQMPGIPSAPRAVERVRDTPSQTSLTEAERLRNVRGAFAVHGARALRGLLDAGHVAVVDDVMTTGSTLKELQTLLLESGVARVDLWSVAQVARAER